MKKVLFIFIFFLLAGGFFGVGIYLAEKQKNNTKEAENSQTEDFQREDFSQAKDDGAGLSVDAIAPAENKNSETQAVESEKFTFSIVGDTQNSEANNPAGNLAKAAKNIAEQNPKFIFAMGDLVSSCDGGKACENKLAKWKSFFEIPVYAVQGNHDRTNEKKSDELWQRFFDLPKNGPEAFRELTYSFDYLNSHFVVLASDKPEEHIVNHSQRVWLENDLAINQKKHIFVFFHEPAYPTSSKIGESLDVEPEDRDPLWAILRKHKVTAVFSGHEHIHSRKKIEGIYQFIFGNTDSFNHETPKQGTTEYSFVGSHFGSVEVTDQKITVRVFAVDGTLLNSFELPAV